MKVKSGIVLAISGTIRWSHNRQLSIDLKTPEIKSCNGSRRTPLINSVLFGGGVALRSGQVRQCRRYCALWTTEADGQPGHYRRSFCRSSPTTLECYEIVVVAEWEERRGILFFGDRWTSVPRLLFRDPAHIGHPAYTRRFTVFDQMTNEMCSNCNWLRGRKQWYQSKSRRHIPIRLLYTI